MKLVLPQMINNNALLSFMAELGSFGNSSALQVDFGNLRRITPAGLVSLAAAITAWRKNGCELEFVGLSKCLIRDYLARMDLFKWADVDVDEKFERRESKGRFVPIQNISHKVEEMGDAIAGCLAPGGEDYDHPLASLYDLIWYAWTEVANNVRQHSQGDGYAAAQTTTRDGLVRIAIADNGIGIRNSFAQAGLPWAKDVSDAEAIIRAFEPKTSSKGQPTNEGVGLTLVSNLTKLMDAWLLVVSGSGVVMISRGQAPVSSSLANGARFPGSLIALSFDQNKAVGFTELLKEAKVVSGLLPKGVPSGIFRP
jgi:anti-sigma regulatory factor (Ser/Thr protein kinase)